jgi:hypothetical protein
MTGLGTIMLSSWVFLSRVLLPNILESASQIKANDIVSYFDDGGDLIIIGDIDTDRSFRKLFYAFGV